MPTPFEDGGLHPPGPTLTPALIPALTPALIPALTPALTPPRVRSMLSKPWCTSMGRAAQGADEAKGCQRLTSGWQWG